MGLWSPADAADGLPRRTGPIQARAIDWLAKPVMAFLLTTIARERTWRSLTRSPILILTMSHPRSLLSIARSNIARSRSRRSRSSQNLMAHTC
jgi:hypothetical protein